VSECTFDLRFEDGERPIILVTWVPPEDYPEARGRELTEKIRDLESKLSQSIPRTELDTANAEAESRIRELETKLTESKSETDALKEKAAGLESRAAEAERNLEAARQRIKELEAASGVSVTQEKPPEPTA